MIATNAIIPKTIFLPFEYHGGLILEESLKKKQYELFVDAKPYYSEGSSVTGAEIKAKASIPATYQLFEEVEGDHPDRAISDSESVDLAGRVKHFFAVPPAAFGS